jgi:hypothetical protein
VSYFRPQQAGKIGPRTIHSFSDSTSRLSQNAGRVMYSRLTSWSGGERFKQRGFLARALDFLEGCCSTPIGRACYLYPPNASFNAKDLYQ